MYYTIAHHYDKFEKAFDGLLNHYTVKCCDLDLWEGQLYCCRNSFSPIETYMHALFTNHGPDLRLKLIWLYVVFWCSAVPFTLPRCLPCIKCKQKNVAILGSVYKLLGEGWDNLLTFSPKFVTH